MASVKALLFFPSRLTFLPLYCYISFIDTTVSHRFVPGVYRIINIHSQGKVKSVYFNHSLFLSKNHQLNTRVGISGCLFE